jgi:2-hydroxychromene-2-carboxylate isomerase
VEQKRLETLVARLAAIAALGISLVLGGCGAAPEKGTTEGVATADDDAPVHAELVIFILARCPHCADFMRVVLPLKEELGPALELGLGYVGTIDASGEADFAHGDAEVAAAELQVCVGLNTDDEEWIGFLTCVYEGDAWREMPKGWTKCAERVGLDIGEITTCLDDGDGRRVLGQSIEAAAASGIEAAPTAVLDGRLYVGGRTREALLAQFCHLAGEPETRPALCADVAPPPEVKAVLLEDRRCEDPRLCDVTRELGFLGLLIPTLDVAVVDFSSDEGRRLYDEVVDAEGPRQLPLLLFDSALAGYPAVLDQMREHLLEHGGGYLMPLGEGWDPLAEICDNEVDDNGDGAIDCDDAACAESLTCREEIAGRLDLFMMSQCPFATEVIPSLDHFLDHFGRDRKQVDLELQFIGRIVDGEPTSMHGQTEVAEDLRMACAQSLYRSRYKYMGYVACRAADYESPDWESCVPKGMSADKLRKCAEGEKGRKLIEQSFALARSVGALGSPTFILSNNREIDARTAAELFEAFCAANDRKACKKSLAPEPEAGEASSEKCE